MMSNWTKRPSLLAAGLLLAGLVGCGEQQPTEEEWGTDGGTRGADAGNGDGGGETIELDQFAEQLSDALCSDLYECCNQTERGALLGNREFSTEEGCRTTIAPLYDGLESRLKTAVDEGRLTYDAEAAGQCFLGRGSSRCGQFPNAEGGGLLPTASGDSCEDWITPEVELGGTCRTNLACQEGFCWIPAGAEEGTCRERPGEGENCASCMETGDGNRRCSLYGCAQDGYRCQTTDGSGSETEHVCQAVGTAGEQCSVDSDCRTRLCGEDGTCEAKKAPGEPCEWGGACESGFCNDPNPDDDNPGSCLAAPICDGEN